MSRYIFQDFSVDGNGAVIPSATVSVYLKGTTTAASVYTTETGTTAVNSVTSDSTNGSFSFWVDPKDYDTRQKFKYIVSKTGFTSHTFDNIVIFPEMEYRYFAESSATDQGVDGNDNSLKDLVDSIGSNTATIILRDVATYTLSTSLSIPENITLKINPGSVISIAAGVYLRIRGPLIAGCYQIFDDNQTAFDSTDGVFFGGESATYTPQYIGEVYPEWWGALPDGSAAATTTAAFKCALQTCKQSVASKSLTLKLNPVGTYTTNAVLTPFTRMTIIGAESEAEYGSRAKWVNETTNHFEAPATFVTDVLLKGISCYGDSTNMDTFVFAEDSALKWSKIIHCGFEYFDTALHLTATGVWIKDCYVNHCKVAAIEIHGSDNIIADNFLQNDTTAPTNTDAVLCIASCSNSWIINNFITANTSMPMKVNLGDHLKISGNTLAGGAGCAVYFTVSDSCYVNGNRIYDVLNTPFSFYTAAILFEDCHDIEFTGNYFDGTLPASSVNPTYRFIVTNADIERINIHDNIYDDTNSYTPAIIGDTADVIDVRIIEPHQTPWTHPSKTGDYTVKRADWGRNFNNIGAGGTITFTLPPATKGLKYKFTRSATQAVRMDPDGSEVIRGGGAGKYLSLDTDGAAVTLECTTTGYWDVPTTAGTTSFEA